MAKNKTIEQPNDAWKAKLGDITNAEPVELTFRGKTRKLGWVHYGTYKNFERIMVKENDIWKRNVKLAACALMNVKSGFWSMVRTKFYYPFYWRWLFYVKDVDMVDVLLVLDTFKKKIQSEPYLMCTILSTGLMDEIVGMTMKTRELKAGQVAQDGDNSSH